MKTACCLSALFILIGVFAKAQHDTTYQKELFQSDYYLKVHGFIPQSKTSFTLFYAAPDGAVIDSVANPGKHNWICVIIESQEGEWAKLKSVQISPGGDSLKHLSNLWIPIDELWLNLSIDGANFYTAPDEESINTKVPYHAVNILEIRDNWAKVQVEHNGTLLIGWVRKKDQCGFPWTSCTY